MLFPPAPPRSQRCRPRATTCEGAGSRRRVPADVCKAFAIVRHPKSFGEEEDQVLCPLSPGASNLFSVLSLVSPPGRHDKSGWPVSSTEQVTSC
eukprot:768457-Hanusia_phi.AAC.6